MNPKIVNALSAMAILASPAAFAAGGKMPAANLNARHGAQKAVSAQHLTNWPSRFYN